MPDVSPLLSLPPAAYDPEGAQLDALRRLPESQASAAAAKELETVFLTDLLRAMRRTVPEDDYLPRSPEREVFDGAFDRTVAESMAARDPLGLVRTLGQAGLKSAPPAADRGNGQGGSSKGGLEG
ncbi:MAG TPA: rod-binding protein [Candidatus Binatia bacterium]|nr:rod-binding protein [Candidatus Binatia bacterium]